MTTADKDRWFKRVRREYLRGELTEKIAGPNPILLFARWYEDALKAKLPEPNAMVLSTVDASGQPQSRIVLLKDYSHEGLCFFTNYKSAKAMQMESNPRVSLLFYWAKLERQIKIVGSVSKVSREISQAYARTRPRGAQLSAHCSPQSQVIRERSYLEERRLRLEKKFRGKEIPCPEWWGGYRVSPMAFEFWQGREDKLHDRLFFTKKGEGWKRVRLAP